MFCTQCGKENNEESKVCVSCGAPLYQSSASKEEDLPKSETQPAFESISNQKAENAFSTVKQNEPEEEEAVSLLMNSAQVIKAQETKPIFAEGLPEWDLTPSPYMMVVRH